MRRRRPHHAQVMLFGHQAGMRCEITRCYNIATVTAKLPADARRVALCDDCLDQLRAAAVRHGDDPEELDVEPLE